MPPGWPLLRRAPARMLHSGNLAMMILVSVGLLAGLVAAGPLFGSATGAGGLTRRLAAIPETAAANKRSLVRVTESNGPPAAAEATIDALVNSVPYLDGQRTSITADAYQLDPDHPTPYLSVAGQKRAAVLYFRTGAVQALQVVTGTRGAPGIWLPDGAAKELGIKPGQTIEIGKSYHYQAPACQAAFVGLFGKLPPDTNTPVQVAGTYRTTTDGRLPAGVFFAGISAELPSDPSGCPTNALTMIADRATFDGAVSALQEQPLWTYTADLSVAGRTPSHLAAAAAAADRIRVQSAQPGTTINDLLGEGSASFRVDSGLPVIHTQAVADARAASEQGRGIAYAGGLLGLAAVIVGLRALAARRRRETDLLVGLGTPTRVVIGASALEMLLPAVAGGAIGWGVACLAFRTVGPHPQPDPAAVRAAAVAAGLVALVAIAGNVVVTLGQVRQLARSLSGRPPSRLGSPLLPLLTGATAIAVVATLTQESGRSYQDPLTALLPILVLACGCALIARAASALFSGAQRLRAGRTPSGARPERAAHGQPRPRRAGPLVLRGLRRTGVAVGDLVIVLAVGVGILAYGLLSAQQVDESVTDKASVLAGATSTAQIPHSWLLGGGDGPTPKLPIGTAVVWRTQLVMTPDNAVYDVLVVDPASLRTAASWGSGPQLAAAKAALAAFPAPPTGLAKLAPKTQPAAPALLIGSSDRKAGTTAQITIGVYTEPVRILRHLSAFPGAVNPTLVLDARTYFPLLDSNENPSLDIQRSLDIQGDYETWVWSRESLPALQHRLADRAVTPFQTFSLSQAQATPVLTSGRWAAAYQGVLGLAAAALAGLALVVAVDRRVAAAAPVDLVLKRFGIRPARLLGLRALELVLTCVAALVVVAAPLALMVALLPRLIEPDPDLPPAMLPHVSVPPLLISAAVAVGLTGVAVAAAARRSATLRPGEVLRDDT